MSGIAVFQKFPISFIRSIHVDSAEAVYRKRVAHNNLHVFGEWIIYHVFWHMMAFSKF